MYTPEAFKLEKTEWIQEIVQNYPFALVISTIGKGLEATHLPLLADEQLECLLGHMIDENPLLQENSEVLCVFSGPHAYISPSWYETSKAVPTWNYISVHIKGTMNILNAEETEKVLKQTVEHFEKADSPYKFDTPDAEYRKALATRIKGFKIRIHSIEAKAKLSQNHSPERRKLVIQKLGENPTSENLDLARWMNRFKES
ncbi:sporulation protein [Leptospira perolatii]|uniref:Sporulation protein n=1 Tax=Leptospira perolatii TaxID=2023191 RepID=A0A2M9ZJH0_9LEPT|nr:FMN-binding negative transcriptional regulator [Leptospira perolatii]PJZ68841.1 sporulation protein [Leptospira perolatii]PJZ72172.1 sporulation protein [Leptospira perolatii]